MSYRWRSDLVEISLVADNLNQFRVEMAVELKLQVEMSWLVDEMAMVVMLMIRM